MPPKQKKPIQSIPISSLLECGDDPFTTPAPASTSNNKKMPKTPIKSKKAKLSNVLSTPQNLDKIQISSLSFPINDLSYNPMYNNDADDADQENIRIPDPIKKEQLLPSYKNGNRNTYSPMHNNNHVDYELDKVITESMKLAEQKEMEEAMVFILELEEKEKKQKEQMILKETRENTVKSIVEKLNKIKGYDKDILYAYSILEPLFYDYVECKINSISLETELYQKIMNTIKTMRLSTQESQFLHSFLTSS